MSGARSGPAGMTRPLPMPTPASTATSDRSLASAGFWKPSSMMMRSTPSLEQARGAGGAVAGDHGRRGGGEQQRLVADLVGARGSPDRRGAGPWRGRHSRGRGSPASARGRARCGRARSRSASCRRRRRRNCRRRSPATGGRKRGGRAMRQAAAAPQSLAAGQSAMRRAGRSGRHQKAGAARLTTAIAARGSARYGRQRLHGRVERAGEGRERRGGRWRRVGDRLRDRRCSAATARGQARRVGDRLGRRRRGRAPRRSRRNCGRAARGGRRRRGGSARSGSGRRAANERAADEGDRRDAVEEAEFAERVGEVDVDRRRRAARRRSAARPQARRRRAWRGSPRRAPGWRGTMMVSRSGWRLAQELVGLGDDRLLAVMGARREPDRPPADRGREARDLRAGRRRAAAASNLRLPVTTTLAHAERGVALAVAGRLGQAEVDARRTAAGDAAEAAPARNERSDSRALTRISGIAAAASSVMIVGHSSDSTKSARSGRQWRGTARRTAPMSSGANWWMAPVGSRAAATSAEVTVTEVKTTEQPAAVSRSISGRTALVSPTLAAWTQTSRPGGRASVARP